ncbi:5-oxoprolinase subunit B family protein [Streptomyces sp. bgisy100]|uniref:5-oxoprolinase subunit B family protein n=1 Tax=Streptomyces sp. bgisy100 TaxID=3413783 RepID=UPI003D70A3A9
MRVIPVGEDSLLVDLDGAEQAQALYAELRRRGAEGELTGVREIVPAAQTVLLRGVDAPDGLAAELPRWQVPPLTLDEGPLVEIPVRYDGADLATVAALWGVAPEEVPEVHASHEHRVAFCGFAPGFGYMTGLPEQYHVPRRDTPRTSVPAGSVALAGPYTSVYPSSSPGGWQLIGTTGLRLWDVSRDPAALLTPGTRVRFVPEDPARPGAESGAARSPARTAGPS